MALPTEPLYVNAAGQPIFWIEGANVGTRARAHPPSVLVIHDTAGTDSREYLRKNDRGVSCHYLVGLYADTPGARIYKYASEALNTTHTQGPGRLGGIRASNINDVAISVEIELSSLNAEVIGTAARLCREIIRGWQERGRQLVMLPHHIIQADKSDPRLDWRAFCQAVYAQ